jgi:enoyl reductase-like protein/3-oxoacyl-ACP reductase-like protein
LRAGDARVAVVFGGQGAQWLPALRELHGAHLAVRSLVRDASARLRASASDPRLGALATPARGFDLARWMDDPAAAPPDDVLSSSLLSQAGIFLASVARAVAMAERGFDLDVLAERCLAATGHSQGVMAALLFAEGHAHASLTRRAAELASYFFWQGYRMQESFVLAAVPPAVRAASEQAGLGDPTPMAAVAGMTSEHLAEALARFHAANPQLAPIDVSLDNGYTRKVLSGPPASLVAFARALAAARTAEAAAFAKGKLGRRPIEFAWEFVAASAPFHSRYMDYGRRALPDDLAREGIHLHPAALRLPVLGNDGSDLRALADESALLDALLRMQFVEPVRWAAVCAALRQAHPAGVTHLLDYGPGDAVAKLTGLNCRGYGVQVFALATDAGRRDVALPLAEMPRAVDYRRFAPTLRKTPAGEVVLDNAFRRFTGRAPVFLPGMTPTTAEAPIVAAAANAGFVSELAGGGQVTERHFRLRAKELAQRLAPGAAYVVNLLYLDPYLWNLHWKGEGLVRRLRAEGAAIEGITVSAGIPDVAEAREIVDACRAAGIGLVSFKPGTAKQIKAVLEIARACPDVTLGMQVEGGKAGGHHSWEDVRDLIRGSYHQVREHTNVVLSVGGGIRSEADAWEWLSGRWSEALGLAPMPVDGVFLGTLTMVAAEACTSPSVKALLARTTGTDAWVAQGATRGGMTSGKSQLDADIHYVDNTAARVGRMLDEVAGNAAAALARKPEIIAALAKTAKPYFGELTEMTHADVLRRMVSLMAIGRGTDYDDGRWPDVSYRQRVFDVAARFEEALAPAAGPSLLRDASDLDDPDAFVARFVARYPDAERVTLAQADADFFVHRVCARPGKPVNFVPAIDGDVRRWYKSDSLWQSHDDRYDADQVLVIPGPEAVQGITAVDEPVGAMLGRFVAYGVAQLEAAGQSPVAPDDRCDDVTLARAAEALGLVADRATGELVTGPSFKPPTAASVARWLEALDPVVLAPLAAASGVLRGRSLGANPLARMLRVEPGDRWTVSRDASQRVTAVTVRRAAGHAVVCSLTRQGDLGRCDVTLVHALPSDRTGKAPEVSVALAYERDLRHESRYPRDVTEGREAALGAFYRAAMVGEAAPVMAGEEVRARFTIDADFVREYALASGDASTAYLGGRGHAHAMPLNAAFSAAFGAIFRATFVPDVAWDPSRLVHLENVVRGVGRPLQEGETVEVAARLVAWEPVKGGVRARVAASLQCDGAARATVVSSFFVQGADGAYRFRDEGLTHRLPAGDPALLDLLAEKPWLVRTDGAALDPRVPHLARLRLRTVTDGGRAHATVTGELLDPSGRVAAVVAHEGHDVDAADTEAARWFTHFAPTGDGPVALPQPSAPHVERAFAPWNLLEFARASRDANPLHRDAHVAALAGFDRPIVHGQWTAARAVAAAVTGFAATDGERVRAIEVNFTDTVFPGDEVEFRARHTGMREGELVVEVDARALDGGDGRLALRGIVRIAAPKTAYVFPGQGVQTTGMGMEGYARSAAARRVWDEADALCRDTLGFSLLTVVRENPVEMRVGVEVHRHDQGVLFLTQFTQVAMAVLAIAQVAELRESGCFQPEAMFCGHSVGEYSAIGAVTDALPLAAVVECVYQRGLTMQTFVPRDAQGRSPYRMAVVRPNLVGMSEADLTALVARIAHDTGLLCEVVNLNIRGRQYSVVGHIPALDLLRARLAEREPPGSKPAYLEVPGIDVPFHSVALRSGVDAFREKLDAYMPPGLDLTALVGRYIPNLVARPFALTRAYLDEVAACTGSAMLTDLQRRWDADARPPAGLGRSLFIEGLAYQFASPVRWIETQDIVLARDRSGVSRVVEIGLAAAPTQANMFRATLGADPSRLDPPVVYNVEAERKAVFYLHDPESLDAPAPTPAAAAPSAKPVAAPVAAPTSARGPVSDAPLSVRDSLATLLALKARVRVDEVRPEESIEVLFGGNSSKRNQVMADLGAEFGVAAIDGAHEMPFLALAEAVTRATSGRYKAQGPYLRAQVAAALKPFGLGLREALAAATARGLPEGRSLALLNRVALWLRAGDSTRAGALSPVAPPKPGDRAAASQWLDAAIARYASDEGLALGGSGGEAGGATVDAATLEKLLARYFGVGGAFLESLRFAESALGRDVWAELAVKDASSDEPERLGRYDAEHGEGYERAIRPAFASEKAVVFTGTWAWSRREALALYHRLRAGNPVRVAESVGRIARGADAAALRTVLWLRDRATRDGDAATAAVFEGLAARIDLRALPHAESEAVPLAPAVEVLADGRLQDFERPRGGHSAAAVVEELLAGHHARLRLHTDASDPGVGAAYATALRALARAEVSFAGRTALVTGASDRSIAIELVKLLLTGGARVVVTTSQLTPERVRFYRRLFQRYGARGAELAVVPFNQGSRQDIQRLVHWLVSTEKTTVGGTQRTVKEPWLIDLLVPFGAVGEEATLAEISERSMATLRVLLYGVEALVSECARAFSRLHVRETRTHVLLPLSPNHGQFGNDGLYGEAKAALEAMLNRWGSEQAAWGRHTSVVGARIGWVRGTGLMNVNNAIAPGLEARAGVRTFSAAEMGLALAACCVDEVRALATEAPLVADLTGGMDAVRDLAGVARSLRAELTARVARAKRLHGLRADEDRALGRRTPTPRRVTPSPRFERYFAFPPLPSPARRDALAPLRALDLSRVAVIVGLGEIGPWGGARPRWSMESTGELSVEACVELAWMTGRIKYEKSRQHVGWVDVASGNAIAGHEVKARYEEALTRDAGVRIVDPKDQNGFDPRKLTVWADVALEQDFVFPVPGRAEGEAFVAAAGDGARLVFDPAKDGWFIVRRKGTVVKVARAARLNRYVAGQIPSSWDPVRYGIPKDLVEQVDRTTLYNLVATVEAFLSAGLEPEELYEYLHPSDVGSTQGAGIGGMQKIRRLYLDHPLDRPRQGDALQETLINVTAAWVVQTLVGSYGPMSHPVGACATAAVSVEDAADKVLGGKAAFIVAGGFDDYGEEGAMGFADMAATADTDDMLARSIPPREMSRPNDRRRRGFVEAQGGGTVLVARADLAVRMGLPIYAVVALARSYGDGIHRSIPAPGPGVMAVAAERLAREGEATAAALCDLATRTASWEHFAARLPELTATLGEERATEIARSERRRLFHDFAAGDERVSPLRRALATFGLGPDDVAAAWKHDTSTDANDPNENRAYDRIFRWLGRAPGNPLVAVSQKALTGHSKGGAAAWQVAGLCQALASGVLPGNPNLDDPDPTMRAYETMCFTDEAIALAPGSFEAGMVTSLGFGHVGGVVCLVHPDRALAALDDEAFARYRKLRDARERQRLRDELAVYESTRPAVRIRTDKTFAVPADERYAGLDGEQAVLLDAASRRLTRDGPIVAGGVAERIGLPDAPVASPKDF